MTQSIKLHQISSEVQCRRETFIMIWNVLWESHRMKHHLVRHVTRRNFIDKTTPKEKWGKLNIVPKHVTKETLMINGMNTLFK